MTPKRILIIEDESLAGRAVADLMAERGYQASTAADGADGLAQARSEQFDLVLVDLRLPRVDGLAIIAALKSEQPELPLVAISAAGELDNVIQAMRCGAWDYIAKPIQNMDEVAVVVERALDKARLKAERDRYQRELERINCSLEAEIARQTEHLRIHNRELAALNHVSYAISGSLDLDTMLNRAIDAAIAALEADGGMVRLLNPVTGQLVVAAARGLPPAYLASAAAIPLGQGIIGQVAQNGHPRAGRDFANDPWIASLAPSAPDTPDGFRSFLCAPLRAWDEGRNKTPIVGTLGVVVRNERAFEPHEVELLAAIGNQIGVAVERTRYAADLENANVQLERANAELRQLDVIREQFIQNVAHELRTPLALVHGYVDMLAQGELSSDEQSRALSVVSRHVQLLVNLVETITTLQDLSSLPLRLEKIAPAELLETACQMARQRAASAGITLRHACPPDLPHFRGDFTRLAQALHQLLDNACKFSPQGASVTATVQLASGGDALSFSVTDHGIGIPAAEHERIFERFYQVDGSTTRRFGGTGLGLALVKEIVQAHGGQVAVQSAPGQGSAFTITLPLRSGK